MQNTIYKELAPWKIQRDPVDVIGIAWSTHNEKLADWAIDLFLLRHDGHGRYRTRKEIRTYEDRYKGDDGKFTHGKRKGEDFEPLGEQTTVKISKDRDRRLIMWMALCLHFAPSRRSDVIGMLCYLPDYRDKANPRYYPNPRYRY